MGKGCELLAERPPVDDVTLPRDPGHAAYLSNRFDAISRYIGADA